MYDALGLRFTVSCPDEPTRAYVAHLLSGLSAPDPGDAGQGYVNDFTVEDEATRLPDALATLVGMINLRGLGAARGSLLLHAGAVSIGNAGCAILCGPSGSGKSTLTAALSRRHAYVTDEIVCLVPDTMRLRPFRKPLALKNGAHDLFPHLRPPTGSVGARYAGERWLISADTLGGPPLPATPLAPNVVVFPTYRQGAATRVQPITEAESAYRLGSNATQLSVVRGGGLPALARLARRAPAFEVTYGDLGEAVAAVEELSSEAA
jgi:hypothetical protein